MASAVVAEESEPRATESTPLAVAAVVPTSAPSPPIAIAPAADALTLLPMAIASPATALAL